MRASKRRRLKRRRFISRRAKKLRRKRAGISRAKSIPPYRERLVKVTRKQKRKAYEQTPVRVSFPPQFDLIQNPEESIKFFDDLREAILINPRKTVLIEHNSIKQLSPAAGIALIAELFRADAYAPSCVKRGSLPQVDEVGEIFQKIGYWGYFGIQYQGKSSSNRQFMIHKTGNRVTPKLVADVISHFRDAVKFTKLEERRLYVALIECLDNVMNHAYPYRKLYDPPLLRHQWWMLAYKDSVTHEVCVCFYDQGAGIAETIRNRANAQLLLIPEPDGELVIKAVLQGYFSRHAGLTRGTGLPSLKEFVDEANSGELIIMTRGVICYFPHGERPHYKELSSPMGGTLIQWRLSR